MKIEEILRFNIHKNTCKVRSEPLGDIQENRGVFFCYNCSSYEKVNIADSLKFIKDILVNLREKFKEGVMNGNTDNISERKKTFRKSISSYLEFLALLNPHIRDITTLQNFLKNDDIYSLERSDLIPKFLIDLGNILFIGINKYYHFFLISFMINSQNI